MKRLKLALIAIFAMIMLFTLPFAVACNDASDNTPDNSANTDDKDKDNTDNQDKDPDKEPDGGKDDDGNKDDDGGKDDDGNKDDDGSDDEDPTAKLIWAGSWKNLDGTSAFTVSEDATAVTVGNTAAADVTSTGDALSFTAGDTTYALTWYDGLVGGKIAVLTEGSKTSYYIPDAAAEIGDDFNGTWYDLLDTNTLTIDAEAGTAAFNGETAVAVVDCGVVGTLENNDGSTANVDHQCLYLIMENGDIIFVGWYKDSTSAGQANGRAFNCPEVTIPETSETPLTHRPFIELYVDEDLDGTWTNVNAGGSISIEIDAEAKTAKVGGTAVEIYNNGGTRGAGNIIVAGGTKYRLEPDPGYNYYLTRETVVDLGMGQRDYFLKEGHEPLKVVNTELLNTEWEQDFTMQNSLKIDGEGNISFNNTPYVIYVAELVEGTTSYKVIAFSADNKKLELSYVSGVITLSEGMTATGYHKKGAGSGTVEVGFLGLPMGTATNPEGKSIIVNEDSLVIRAQTFDFWDDSDITLTMGLLHEEDTPLDGSSKHYTYTWTSVTFEKEQVIHIALDVQVKDFSSQTTIFYKLMIAFGENAENPFFQVGDGLPDVKFNPSTVKSFDPQFQGTWVSETGEEIVIGEKVMRFKGKAVETVACKGSENDISYNFVMDGTQYSMSWARTDYTVGYVLDVLNVSRGTREDFLRSTATSATVDSVYYGDWTARDDDGTTYTLKIDESGIVYNGEPVGKIVDGGYYDVALSTIPTPIGTNIYFFLNGGIVHLLIWNGDEEAKFPTVQYGSSELLFNNPPEVVVEFAEALRGTWVSSAGKTIDITANTFKIDGKDVTARTFNAAILYTEDGKSKELSVNDGTNYVVKVKIETYGSDGLISSWSFEYYYKSDRPKVTVDPSLNGTWTGAPRYDDEGHEVPIDAITIQDGVIKWGDKTATLIEAGEDRSAIDGGFVYFIDFDGEIYNLFAYDMTYDSESGTGDGEWAIELSGPTYVDTFTKNS